MSFPEAATPPELRRQVLELQHQAWPPENPTALSASPLTHDPTLRPLSMLLVKDGRVLAALDIQSGLDKVTMAAFFSAEAQRHRSSFQHAHIELYPGEIDKLW